MELDVFWTAFAKNQLAEIYAYYKEKANSQVAKKIINGIISESKLLIFQPQLGQIEELLTAREENFRYLIYSNYKIIYWLNDKKGRIEIVDVFDTRQNPIKIKRSK